MRGFSAPPTSQLRCIPSPGLETPGEITQEPADDSALDLLPAFLFQALKHLLQQACELPPDREAIGDLARNRWITVRRRHLVQPGRYLLRALRRGNPRPQKIRDAQFLGDFTARWPAAPETVPGQKQQEGPLRSFAGVEIGMEEEVFLDLIEFDPGIPFQLDEDPGPVGQQGLVGASRQSWLKSPPRSCPCKGYLVAVFRSALSRKCGSPGVLSK